MPLAIDGIDTENGLKRLGGKRERYEQLLRKFAARQAGSVEAMCAAITSGDMATAERDAHSLKGSAATLGADRLVVSRRTVDHHVSAILRKLEAKTRGEAVAEAARLGILDRGQAFGPT